MLHSLLQFSSEKMIRTVQITEINFDLTLDDEDAWEIDDSEMLQESLQNGYIGQIFELEVPDDADDEEIEYELCEEVSESSGWCINSIDFRHILR
jgi:hypothetical protein